jgi:hypothetical protein
MPSSFIQIVSLLGFGYLASKIPNSRSAGDVPAITPRQLISSPSSDFTFARCLKSRGWSAQCTCSHRFEICLTCEFTYVCRLLYTLPNSNRAGKLIGYWLNCKPTIVSHPIVSGADGSVHTDMATTCSPVYYALLSANTSGSTKKAVTNMVVFAGYSAGQLVGAHFFLDSQAPSACGCPRSRDCRLPLA